MREADARILIDRKIREAGWEPEDKNQVITEETSQAGRADYILKDSRGRGIAVIEAKRFSVDPASAKQQALSYAESIKAEFIFLSNGEEIYFWDYKYRSEQKVATFYSQRDLEKIQNLRLEQKSISVIPIPEKYFKGGEWRIPRPYQKEAMQIMDKALEGGKRKMLLVMATGTGKTDVIALYLKRLFEAGLVNRALFLVDRIDLGVQAKEVFDEILKDYPSKLLYGGKQRDESSIIISTLPTLYSQLSLFTSGYFDVIVSDEAHRSILVSIMRFFRILMLSELDSQQRQAYMLIETPINFLDAGMKQNRKENRLLFIAFEAASKTVILLVMILCRLTQKYHLKACNTKAKITIPKILKGKLMSRRGMSRLRKRILPRKINASRKGREKRLSILLLNATPLNSHIILIKQSRSIKAVLQKL